MKPEDPAHQHSSSLPSSNQTETISTQQRVPEVTPEIAPTDPPVAPELAEIETPDGELTLILNNQVQSVEQEPHLESTTSIAAAPISTVNSEPQAAVSPLPKIQGPGYTVTELYIPPASANAVVDIIFVHGLIGNAFNTWYHKQAEVYWPQELLKEDIRDARIMSFGYDADVVNWWSQASNNRIGNHAENMLGALVRLREETDTEERRIVFVTHSLGGLVTQKALALSRHSPFPHLRQLETCTRGIIFLGTPHIGADIAKWGGYAAKISSIARHTNVEIVKVLKPDSEMLGEIQRDFQGILRLRIEEHKAMEISCFFEELPVRLVGTVSFG